MRIGPKLRAIRNPGKDVAEPVRQSMKPSHGLALAPG